MAKNYYFYVYFIMKQWIISVWDIGIAPANSLLEATEYVRSIRTLIERSMKVDPTLVLHSREEILGKYPRSIVAFHKNTREIIWNSSLYPTEFRSLALLQTPPKNASWITWFRIGESGSSVIDPRFRRLGIGREMIIQADVLYWTQYDAIIWATVNPVMKELRIRELGYEIAPFPKDLYEEWKKFLAPRMRWWIREFEEKAVCLVKIIQERIRIQLFQSLNSSL